MIPRTRSSERGVFGSAENFEIEGDGPLGIIFRENGDGIAIRSVVRETAAAESPGLLDGMLLLEVESRDASQLGYAATMSLIDRTWAETNCVTLRLQPPRGAVEVYNFLERVGCENRFEAFHDFGARTMVDLDFVEKEDFAELGLDAAQQARLAAAMVERDGSGLPAAAPAPAPAVVQQPRAAAQGVTQSVSSFLASVGCASSEDSFHAYGVRTLDDLPYMEPSDYESMGLTAEQQIDLTRALAEIFPPAGAAAGAATGSSASSSSSSRAHVKPLDFSGAVSDRPSSAEKRHGSNPVTPTHDPLGETPPTLLPHLAATSGRN